MQESEFREWLQAGGAQTEAGRNSRIHAVRTIERKLADLGSPCDALADAWESDRFESLRQRIRDIRQDARNGGEDFRILMPESQKPLNRLSNWNSWLAQYGRFLAGEKHGEPKDADRIRQYVLEHYIETARDEGRETVDVLVSDVNRALNLNQAWPNICQALAGKIFLEQADLPPPERIGADQSSATVFRFRLSNDAPQNVSSRPFTLFDSIGAAFKPVLNHNSRTGGSAYRVKPPGASNKVEEAIEVDTIAEVARAMLIDGRPARVQSVNGGTVNYVGYGKHKLLRYELDPAIAREIGVPPKGSVTDQDSLDLNALELLRSRFITKFPDFEAEGGFVGRSAYHLEEDDYKRTMVAKVGGWLHDQLGLEALGTRVLDLLTSKDSNLLGYFKTNQRIGAIRKSHPGELEHAIGELAFTTAPPPEAAEAFLQNAWPLLVEGTENNKPFGESRILATVVQALARPADAIAVIYQRFHNLGQALLGRSVFGNQPLTAEEYGVVVSLADQILKIMRDKWGWQPRDYWDVQGFVWVTCATKLKDGENDMTNDEILARFDSNADFRTGRQSWSAEQTDAFCRIARSIHQAGYDWWHVAIAHTPVRFGRKSAGRRRAEAVQGYLSLNEPRLSFNDPDQAVDLGLAAFPIAPENVDQLDAALQERAAEIAAWQAPSPARPGFWPDEPLEEAKIVHEKPNPTNLILYGPPGTGKTYRTALEAVRLCREQIPNAGEMGGREALMVRYRELIEARQVEFVTFHQNFSYEEFVEGLRPETGTAEDGTSSDAGFRLEPRQGVFREIALRAEEAQRAARSGVTFDLANRKIFKMSLGRAGVEDYIFQDAIDGGYAVLGWGGDIDWSKFNTYEAIHERWNQDYPETNGNDANIIQSSRFRVDMAEGDLIIVSYGNHKIRAIGEIVGPYRYEPGAVRDYNHRRDVRWLTVFDEPISVDVVYNVPFIQWSCYLLKEQHLNRAALANLLPGDGPAQANVKQFVLIIDEINRANISKVFGELITLIEPDKRLGMSNALTARLPYSKREFGVPANLHIVGTMNTADRSIALLDTALRRRFQFQELAPDVSLLPAQVDGVPLRASLDTINRRIEYLLDRDHAIGHAFFMGDGGKDRSAIDDTMRFKVIPLLQEYFFEDWSRIHAVLGKGFIEGNILEAPPGVEPRGERKSWRVRRDFTVDAYEHLVAPDKQAAAATTDGATEDVDI